MRVKYSLLLVACSGLLACSQNNQNAPSAKWLLVDNFEQPLKGWTKAGQRLTQTTKLNLMSLTHK